ncbi:Ig-like domain-containing protein [Leucobacter ruminantium]|uniref:LPXTG cell wall anchor domain-containing protein n=1 Tax=Leucobacter ruminantium TaxID=1289170 RepID=A0A939LXH1_9MICO|nr:LPXTG cell wall anchor domain-containing protein [Leucobacter ruminantium]MBO1806500.1 LPXTG cell wall anchor domain-containing protein [Leucobacter ruminantium]
MSTLHPRSERHSSPALALRAASGALALLVGLGALFGIAVPAQAAPPAASHHSFTVPASGQTVELTGLAAGCEITEIGSSGSVQTQVFPPASIRFSSTASMQYPSYTQTEEVAYTVRCDGELVHGTIDLILVHKPWVFPILSNVLTVKPGETVTTEVTARGSGFSPTGAANGGSYSVKELGPIAGSATVANDGTVSYTAAPNATPGSAVVFNVVATDDYGQTGEMYAPFIVRIAGTAEADTFDVEIPYQRYGPGVRVDILPDHARGVNPRVTAVTANPGNAAVAFDSSGAFFTPTRPWQTNEETAYSFAAPYTVADDNPVPANAQINVRVLRPPLVSLDDYLVRVGIGATATSQVKVANAAVIPSGGYRIEQQPSFGSATIDEQGLVTFSAPADAEPGDRALILVSVTDRLGQEQTITVPFEVYESAQAPDLAEERGDAPFSLDLLAGASGEGKALTEATLVSGDATVTPDLAAGTVEVAPTHSWAEGEGSHRIVLEYTVQDARGATDTGAVAVDVLAAPRFAHTAPEDLSKTAEVGDTVEFSAEVLAPQNLPASGAYAVTAQPGLAAATPALALLAAPGSRAAVDGAGLVSVDTAGLAPGRYEFVVRVADRVGQSAEQTFALTLGATPAQSGGQQPRGHGVPALPRTGGDGGAAAVAAALLIVSAAGLIGFRRRAS